MALFTAIVHVHVHVEDLTAELKRVADTFDAVLAKLNEETAAPVIVGQIVAGAPTEQQGA